MKKLYITIVASILVNLLCSGPINATIIDVEVSTNKFTPKDIIINVGDTVRWTNVQGFHNVNGDAADYPANTDYFGNAVGSPGWVYSHTFLNVGFNEYQCDPHTAFGMFGSVTVVCPGDVFEPNNYFSDAAIFPSSGINTEANMRCGNDDTDWFYFNTGDYDNAKVQLMCLSENMSLGVYNEGDSSLVALSDNAANEPEKLLLNGLSLNTNYYVKVVNRGAETAVGYCLHITQSENTFWSDEDLDEVVELKTEFYPNPVFDNINYLTSTLEPTTTFIKVYDVRGRLVHQEETIVNRKASFSFPSKLSSGQYFIKAIEANGKSSTQKFLVK